MKNLLNRISARRPWDHEKVARLGAVPVLAGLDRDTLAEISTWADEITVAPGDAVIGTGPVGRWSYLVVDPRARVVAGDGSRPAGSWIGVDARGEATADPVVAVDELALVAVPATRLRSLTNLVEVPTPVERGAVPERIAPTPVG